MKSLSEIYNGIGLELVEADEYTRDADGQFASKPGGKAGGKRPTKAEKEKAKYAADIAAHNARAQTEREARDPKRQALKKAVEDKLDQIHGRLKKKWPSASMGGIKNSGDLEVEFNRDGSDDDDVEGALEKMFGRDLGSVEVTSYGARMHIPSLADAQDALSDYDPDN